MWLLRSSLCLLLLGCGVDFTASSTTSSGAGGDGAALADGGAATTSAGGDESTGGSQPNGGGGAAAGGAGGTGGSKPRPDPLIYAASRTELYEFNPLTRVHTFVGTFAGCPEVFDLALNSDDELYAVTASSFESIDRATAACTEILGSFVGNALAFLPAGELDPVEEVLVAWDGSSYMRVNPLTGATTTLGNVGNGYTSSGDFVAIGNNRGLLSVYGNGCGDCIVEVDASNGALVKNWGDVGFSEAWGLARWKGTVFLWGGASTSFEVQLSGSSITTIPIPNTPAVSGGYPSAASSPSAL